MLDPMCFLLISVTPSGACAPTPNPRLALPAFFCRSRALPPNARGIGTALRAPCVSSANRCVFPKDRRPSAGTEAFRLASAIAPSKGLSLRRDARLPAIPSATPVRAQSLFRSGRRSAELSVAVVFPSFPVVLAPSVIHVPYIVHPRQHPEMTGLKLKQRGLRSVFRD